MDTRGDELNTVLKLRLDQFDLSTRTANCMHVEGVSTLGELTEKTAKDILGWRNAGNKTLQEIRYLLGRVGLKLSDDRFPVGAVDQKLLSELSISAADV